MPSLGSDEEDVKEGKWLKILTPNKLLTRLPMVLSQRKAGSNSYNLKSAIRKCKYYIYCITIINH